MKAITKKILFGMLLQVLFVLMIGFANLGFNYIEWEKEDRFLYAFVFVSMFAIGFMFPFEDKGK